MWSLGGGSYLLLECRQQQFCISLKAFRIGVCMMKDSTLGCPNCYEMKSYYVNER